MDTVLLLGDPRLRKVAMQIEDVMDAPFQLEIARLKKALENFRKEKGFGRAIAAPQIGINKRFISINLGEGPFSIINPVITWYSDQTFTLWDDCMSFPDLLVKVRRHESIGLRYTDEDGKEKTWDIVDRSESELVQHEMDHLDGILAVDRAIDRDSIIYRPAFEENRNFYLDQVD